MRIALATCLAAGLLLACSSNPSPTDETPAAGHVDAKNDVEATGRDSGLATGDDAGPQTDASAINQSDAGADAEAKRWAGTGNACADDSECAPAPLLAESHCASKGGTCLQSNLPVNANGVCLEGYCLEVRCSGSKVCEIVR